MFVGSLLVYVSLLWTVFVRSGYYETYCIITFMQVAYRIWLYMQWILKVRLSIEQRQRYKLSNNRLFSCGDQDAMPEQETVPSEMLTLGVMLPPSYHVDTWNLIDIGQLGPALR